MLVQRTALALSVLLASPVLADGRADVMLDLMSRVPTAAFDPPADSFAQVRFADQAAVRAALGPLSPEAQAHPSADLAPLFRVDTGDLSSSMTWAAKGTWERLVGFGEGDIEASLVYGEGREAVMLLRLDEEAAGRVAPALLANGYTEGEQDGLAAFVRGEDNAMSLDDMIQGDPLGGSMGYASRVALNGAELGQARNWAALGGAFGLGGHQGHPDLEAMAEVIDRPEWGNVQLLQAATFLPQFRLSEVGTGGIPPWQLGIMADLSSATETVTLVMFSYGTRDAAEAAAAQIAQGWDAPGAGSPMDNAIQAFGEGGDIDEIREAFQTVPAAPSMLEVTKAAAETGVSGERPFVAWVALRRAPEPTELWPVNRAYNVLRTMMWEGKLTIFGMP